MTVSAMATSPSSAVISFSRSGVRLGSRFAALQNRPAPDVSDMVQPLRQLDGSLRT